jgi:hypothetical protein
MGTGVATVYSWSENTAALRVIWMGYTTNQRTITYVGGALTLSANNAWPDSDRAVYRLSNDAVNFRAFRNDRLDGTATTGSTLTTFVSSYLGARATDGIDSPGNNLVGIIQDFVIYQGAHTSQQATHIVSNLLRQNRATP